MVMIRERHFKLNDERLANKKIEELFFSHDRLGLLIFDQVLFAELFDSKKFIFCPVFGQKDFAV